MVIRPNPSPSLGPVSDVNPLVAIVTLGAMGFAIWGVVCAAAIILSAVSNLFALGPTVPAELVRTIILNGIAGLFAGVATVIMRSWPRRATHVEKSFISALFNKGLAEQEFDVVFWGRVLIGAILGFAVGAVGGASGAISGAQLASGSGFEILHNSLYPLVSFVGGGFGGPGGTGIWGILCLIIVVIIIAILVGFLAGYGLHILLVGMGTMAKGATKTYVERVLRERSNEASNEEPHPMREGMIRGVFIGLLSGSLQAFFTAWGVIKFY